MIYRRRPDSDTWHFHRGCSLWPTRTIATVQITTAGAGERPTSGELCDECLAKEKRDRDAKR